MHASGSNHANKNPLTSRCIQDALEPDRQCAILNDHVFIISAFSNAISSHWLCWHFDMQRQKNATPAKSAGLPGLGLFGSGKKKEKEKEKKPTPRR